MLKSERKIIAANWKMNGSISFTENYFQKLNAFCSQNTLNASIVTFIPYTYLVVARNIISTSIYLGAQDVTSRVSNKSTGEISAQMLADCGVSYIMLAHAERRGVLESDLIIKEKLLNALKAKEDFHFIICVGEETRDKQSAKKSIKKQLDVFLESSNLCSNKITIAYEPIWAIGSGLSPSLEHINEFVKFIRENCSDSNTKVIYGGSVNKNNISEIVNITDGVLIGSSSWSIEEFIEILKKYHFDLLK